MNNSVYTVTVAGLLHDIGKLLSRAESLDGSSHNILGANCVKPFIKNKNIIDCIQFHHRQEISQADLNNDNPAFIIYIADNISSNADRKSKEGLNSVVFDESRPLESIYNLLNNHNGKGVYPLKKNIKEICYPETSQVLITPSQYSKIVSDFINELSNIHFEPEYVNSLLELCETYMSYIPSSTYVEEKSDISLFDHSKITAAFAACIYLYLNYRNRTDYHEELLNKEHQFYDEKIFCLFSLDISGIQDFIYTISSKGALKGLRSRSFYLEILLESIADEILDICSLSRANIIYTGGGHAYILLPNDPIIQQNIERAITTINYQLMKAFGTRLFVCYGFEPCSANELMANTGDPESYSNIFRNVSRKISAMKLHRYSADDIKRLNSTQNDVEGRECTVCGMSGELQEYRGDTMCSMCASLAEISRSLIEDDVVFVIMKKSKDKPSLPIFSANHGILYAVPMAINMAKQMLNNNREQVVRIYSKNMYQTDLPHTAKLWMGDYAAINEEGVLKNFIELAESSEGIKRIGIVRADVDNLGTAFVKGFIRENESDNKYKYVTISRTSSLSRSLSIFFKYYINDLLKNPQYSLTGKKGKRNVVIVYSGGDDMFIVGAWDEILSAALDIQKAFNRYSGGTLTISAGFNIFDPKYPISRMAEDTAELEARAKNYHDQYGEKNAISLFGLEMEQGYMVDKHTYSWSIFENKVLGEKYSAVKRLYDCGSDYGNSFLYNILYLIRQAEIEKINIARLAYLLARHEPDNNAADTVKAAYSAFSRSLYKWILDPEDRRQLVTALVIYIYTMRDPDGREFNE